MMRTEETICICGNSIGAMILADLLTAGGRKVTLISPHRSLGGHFAGVTVEGRRYDAGCIVFELSSHNRSEDADLRTFTPSKKNDCGRFFRFVESYISSLDIPLVQRAPSKVWFDSSEYADFIVGDDLSDLWKLDERYKRSMREELAAVLAGASDPLHSRNKSENPLFLEVDFETVSRANHGMTFHREILEPFCRKVTLSGSSAFIAAHHRMLWLPLLFPESLAAALDGKEQTFPVAAFHGFLDDGLFALPKAIQRRLEACDAFCSVVSSISSIRRNGKDYSLLLENGDSIPAKTLVWCAEGDELLRTLNGPATELQKASLTTICGTIERTALKRWFSSYILPSPDCRAFRLTNQTNSDDPADGLLSLCLELNPEVPDAAPNLTAGANDPARQLRETLRELDLIDGEAVVGNAGAKAFRNCLLLPTPKNSEAASRQRKWLDAEHPEILRIGQTAAFGATSLNDQLVQAHALAARLSGLP